MGKSTTLFVTAKKEEILNIMPIVIKDLEEWHKTKLDSAVEKSKNNKIEFLLSNKDNWSNGIGVIRSYHFDIFRTSFNVDGEHRSLYITHTCSCDYSETYDGDKIIFSLGRWGKYDKEIMMVIAKSVKSFGVVYYNHDDDYDDFIKLN